MAKRTIYSEEILAEWCHKGDRKSQKYLYETFANPMFRMVMRYLGNEADAGDVLVTGFTRVLDRIGEFTFRGRGSLEAWIRKIMVNEALMCLRSRKSFDTIDEQEHHEIADENDFYGDLHAEDIYNMVVKLPEGYRTIFNLFVIEGYSHLEISEMLGISESTSKSQLLKARKKLQEKFIKTKTGYELG